MGVVMVMSMSALEFSNCDTAVLYIDVTIADLCSLQSGPAAAGVMVAAGRSSELSHHSHPPPTRLIQLYVTLFYCVMWSVSAVMHLAISLLLLYLCVLLSIFS